MAYVKFDARINIVCRIVLNFAASITAERH